MENCWSCREQLSVKYFSKYCFVIKICPYMLDCVCAPDVNGSTKPKNGTRRRVDQRFLCKGSVQTECSIYPISF